jgi:hypothetical protein
MILGGTQKVKKYVDNSFSYSDYLALIDRLLEEGKTTGPNQSDVMVNFTRLNRQRMQRLDKTVELKESVRAAARSAGRRMIWLVITEAWCGDAAQNIPPIEKIANLNDRIETRYILRDENTELMDQFLTNGSRSIPKLIALDADTLDVLGTWGARPEAAQKLYYELKEKGAEKAAIMEHLQRWYNADRTLSLQNEFVNLLAEWDSRSESSRTSAA